MDVDALVDAALVGFDRKEEVTIPAVHDLSAWEAFERARGGVGVGLRPIGAGRPLSQLTRTFSKSVGGSGR